MRTTIITIVVVLGAISLLLIGLKALQRDRAPTTTIAPTTSTARASGPTLPTLPMTTVENLFANCDYIDYVFQNYDFSISVKETRNVQGNLSYWTGATVPNIQCTPAMGRAYYKVQGETVLEADIHFAEACTYFVFLNQQGQQAYACNMSEGGVTFFTQLARTAEQQQRFQQ